MFRATGYALAGLAVFTGLAHIAQQALSADWNDSYYSGKMIHWTYGSAFIAICAGATAGLIGLAVRVHKRWQTTRDQRFRPARRSEGKAPN